MSVQSWLLIAGWSFAAFGCGIFIGIPLVFSPGWANGWPFGLTIYTVWSVGMACEFCLLSITAAVGGGAIAGALGSHYGIGLRYGRAVYAGWLVFACLFVAWAARGAFNEIYASTLEMWPNGYNP